MVTWVPVSPDNPEYLQVTPTDTEGVLRKLSDKATQDEADEATNDTKYLTPLKAALAAAEYKQYDAGVASPPYLQKVTDRLSRDSLYPHDYKDGVGQGVEEIDTDAMAGILVATGASASGGTIELARNETLYIGESLQWKRRTNLIGKGLYTSKLYSALICEPLFKMGSETLVGCRFADFSCEGNNVTGASGSGHCFEFIDNVGGGAAVPQLTLIENVRIEKFRGQGVSNYARDADKLIEACGIIVIGGLGCNTKDISISDCGRGIVRYATQNCRDTGPLIDHCDMVGIQDIGNENYLCLGGDVNMNGFGSDGTLNYPLQTGFHPCNIMVYLSEGSQYLAMKYKNGGGKAQVVVQLSESVHFDGGWMQAIQYGVVDGSSVKATSKGFYIERSPGTRVTNHYFHLPNPGTGIDTSYECIEFKNTVNSETMSGCEASDIRFGYPIGGATATKKMAYGIKVAGDASTRPFHGFKAKNIKTARAAPGSNSLIDDLILIGQGVHSGMEISGVVAEAPNGVTVTDVIDASGVSTWGPGNVIERNKSNPQGTGAVTNLYNGVTETGGIKTLTDAATITPNLNQALKFGVTIASSRTIADPTGISDNIGKIIYLDITQGGTGSYTITWGSAYVWPSATAPTLTTTVGKTDRFAGLVKSGSIIEMSTVGLNY